MAGKGKIKMKLIKFISVIIITMLILINIMLHFDYQSLYQQSQTIIKQQSEIIQKLNIISNNDK